MHEHSREKRILVVDDDDAIRALLLAVLRRRGFRVDAARNGAEALESLSRCSYALLLLDLMMPRVSGYGVLDALAEAGSRPMVLVLTAGTEPRDLDPEIVVGTVRKPFDIDMLVETITACLNVASGREQLAGCPSSEDGEIAPDGRSN